MKRFALFALMAFVGCVEASETSIDQTTSDLTLSGRQCRNTVQRTIGVCGADPNLLVACTNEFTAACTGGGGTVFPGVPLVVNCQDNSKLLHACDPKFKQSCRDFGGDFGCDNTDCTQGHCTIPNNS